MILYIMDTCTLDNYDNQSWVQRLRVWLRDAEKKFEESVFIPGAHYDNDHLQRMVAEHQTRQVEIERRGGVLVSLARKEAGTLPNVVVLERRWHQLWLRSLERLCLVQQLVDDRFLATSGKSEADDEDRSTEPSVKRRRVEPASDNDDDDDDDETDIDTIPFSDGEYESIMEPRMLDANGNLMPTTTADGRSSINIRFLKRTGKLASVDSSSSSATIDYRSKFDVVNLTSTDACVPDIGYSSENSGQNSNNEDERHPWLESGHSPKSERPAISTRSYYKMTPLDTDGATDTDTPRFAVGGGDGIRTAAAAAAAAIPPKSSSSPLQMLPDNSQIDSTHSVATTTKLKTESVPERDDDLSTQFDEIVNLLDETRLSPAERDLSGSSGTVWKSLRAKPSAMTLWQSCDASSELSLEDTDDGGGRQQHQQQLQQQSGDGTCFCSKQRRRKRTGKSASVCDTSALSWSFCSGAVRSPKRPSDDSPMSRSFTYNAAAAAERTSAGRRRRKGKRLPRSVSDGERLFVGRNKPSSWLTLVPADSGQFTSGLDQSIDGRCPIYAEEPDDAAIDRIDRAESSASERGSKSRYVERVAGDGGSGISAAEQSEAAVWEWDDYKPPNHSEIGPADQPALDDSILTAFGDDYRAFLDQMSDCCSAINDDKRQSLFRETGSAIRLPPIGLSDDSDSDLEHFHQAITDSQKQLRSTQCAWKQWQKGSLTTCLQLLAACDRNLDRLRSIKSTLAAQSPSSTSNEIDNISELLNDWSELASLIELHVNGDSSKRYRSISNDDGTRFCGALQNELRRLSGSLKEILDQNATPARPVSESTSAHGVYKTLEEAEGVVDWLRNVRLRLSAEKRRLDSAVRRYSMPSGLFSQDFAAINAEVEQLRTSFRIASESFDKQLCQLEALRQRWGRWKETERCCRQMLLGPSVSKEAAEQAEIELNPGLLNYKLLPADLVLLDERVRRLEKLCDQLIAPEATPVIDASIATDLHHRTVAVRRQFDELKSRCRMVDTTTSTIDLQPETSFTKSSNRKHARSKSTKSPPKQSILCSDLNRTKTSQPDKQSTSQWRFLYRFWPLQLCLLLFLYLDVAFFSPNCCDHKGRWLTPGPHMHYPDGPPPT